MKIKAVFESECGEKTCAKESGKFCQFFGTSRFGTDPVCVLFPSDRSHTPLRTIDGWVERCPECLAHSVEEGNGIDTP